MEMKDALIGIDDNLVKCIERKLSLTRTQSEILVTISQSEYGMDYVGFAGKTGKNVGDLADCIMDFQYLLDRGLIFVLEDQGKEIFKATHPL